MGKKYIKCPRCELNYILEGEDYCHVCKSEMKHHSEADEDLLDLEDMELCPVCGQNYIREDQTMCDECRGRSKSKSDDDSKDWKDDEEIDEEESMVSASSDIDGEDDEYNSGFSDIDPDAEDDPYKTEDDLMDDSPIEFAMDEEDLEDDDIVSETLKDDFETVEVSGDDDDDDEDEEDDDYDFEGDMLGKKK